jgi:hypothetical protein
MQLISGERPLPLNQMVQQVAPCRVPESEHIGSCDLHPDELSNA